MLKVKKESGNRKSLLDSSSSSESENEEVVSKRFGSPRKKGNVGNDENDDGFNINKNYAERYNSWRNLEEMQKLKDRLKIKDVNELDETDSEESSEEDEEWSSEKEKAFLKTLASLKKKDPKIYSDQFGFFKDVEQDGTEKVEKKTDKKGKPLTVRDHERIMAIEKGETISDEEEDSKKPNPQSYVGELASIKKEISKAAKQIDSSDDDEDDTLLGSKLLKKREVKTEEKERDEEEYRLWLKGELDNVEKSKLSKEDKKELKFLKEYWTDEKLDDGEKFLRDYILNKKYIDPASTDGDYIPSYNEVVHDDDELSNDEKFETEREEFEHKYNFRFEEPDQDFIKRYPRTIQDSMRREDTKRKEQRQKTKEKKEEIISKTRDQVQRLKAMKRKEIMDKIKKLHDVTGNPDLELNEMDIDGDFNPEEYDKRMKELFDDDYYEGDADDEKPEFEYDAEIDGDAEEYNWEEWIPVREGKSNQPALQNSENEAEDGDEDIDDDENGQEDIESQLRSRKRRLAENELIEASKGRRGKRKRSAFLDVLEREKPKFDPKVHKSFEKYFDEYYKLDFEDLVGNMKCRFKYHKTTPNDFGLSTEEILNADDKELNQWASLKKTYQYRGNDEEEYEVQAYKKKSTRDDLKRRILPSVYDPQPKNHEEVQEDDAEISSSENKTKKKKKKNKLNEDCTNNLDGHTNVQDKSEIETTKVLPLSQSATSSQTDRKNKPKKAKLDVTTSDTPDQTEQAAVGAQQTPETPSGLSKRQRKNQKRKLRASGEVSTTGSTVVSNKTTENGGLPTSSSKKNNKGIKRKANQVMETSKMPVDEDRLRAYGINPTKFKKRLKYGGSNSK